MVNFSTNRSLLHYNIAICEVASVFPCNIIAGFTAGIIDMIFAYQIPTASESETENLLASTIKSAMVCAIWIPYFIKSKRVRNTFIR